MHEQTLIFGPESHLVGTVTLPAQSKPGHAGTMALLTNAGVIPRIGPHRLNVRLARRFAEMGIATLRFDLSGLGDSRRSSSRLSTGEQFVADMRSAMDLAQSKFGCTQFFLVGFCSGGDIGHMAALEDKRLRAIVMWDSYVYPTRQAQLRGLGLRLQRYGVGAFVKKAVERLSASEPKTAPGEPAPVKQGPTIFGRTQMPPRDDFGQRIRTLVDQGVEFLFIFSGGASLWYNYEGQFRDMYSSYGFVDRVAYEYHPWSDHTFIRLRAQDTLVESVERWLNARALAVLQAEPESRGRAQALDRTQLVSA